MGHLISKIISVLFIFPHPNAQILAKTMPWLKIFNFINHFSALIFQREHQIDESGKNFSELSEIDYTMESGLPGTGNITGLSRRTEERFYCRPLSAWLQGLSAAAMVDLRLTGKDATASIFQRLTLI
jgi:hypothetical protein